MTRGDEIRRMVCTDPGNDDLRLAYAVWLTDDADPPDPEYGEFVRTQLSVAAHVAEVEAARRTVVGCCNRHADNRPCDCVYQPRGLRKRERALLTKIRDTVRRGLPEPRVPSPRGDYHVPWNVVIDRHFDEFARDDYVLGMDRGFVERVACPAAVWADLADRMYWHPSQTVPCPEPRDPKTGVYLGAGRWEYDERRSHNGCPECGGEGVVPRPCPPSANPIRTVVITTAVDDLFPLTHVSHRPGREGDLGWVSDRWPGVTFLLTPAGYGG